MVESVTAHCYRVWLRDPVSGLTWSPTIVALSKADATMKALHVLSRCEVLRLVVLHATADHPQRCRSGRRRAYTAATHSKIGALQMTETTTTTVINEPLPEPEPKPEPQPEPDTTTVETDGPSTTTVERP